MKSTLKCFTTLTLAFMLTATHGMADTQADETIDWNVVSGGGSNCTSSNYTLEGTVSQTGVSTGASTNYGIHEGYWQVFTPQGCCGQYTGGYTGNANCSTDGKITLSDITALIDHVYISKEELCCQENGNANGSTDGKVTLSDITRLIDRVYISKQLTEPC